MPIGICAGSSLKQNLLTFSSSTVTVIKSVFSPVILPEGYCPHNHDVQILNTYYTVKLSFLFKKTAIKNHSYYTAIHDLSSY